MEFPPTLKQQRDIINMGEFEQSLDLQSAELRDFKRKKTWGDRPASYNVASSKLLLKK